MVREHGRLAEDEKIREDSNEGLDSRSCAVTAAAAVAAPTTTSPLTLPPP